MLYFKYLQKYIYIFFFFTSDEKQSNSFFLLNVVWLWKQMIDMQQSA